MFSRYLGTGEQHEAFKVVRYNHIILSCKYAEIEYQVNIFD